MKLLTQPNKWSCLPTSFAMVAGTSVQDVCEFLKTDGSELIFPELAEPFNRRTFAINEMLYYMLWRGYSVTPLITQFEQGPYLNGQEDAPSYIYRIPLDFIWDSMKMYSGVLSGFLPSGTGHAVAWNHVDQRVYDPVGRIEELPACRLEMETFYLCSPLQTHQPSLRP